MGNSCGESSLLIRAAIRPLTGKKKRTKVFFEVSADDEALGRIEMELFDDIVPR
jgi:hypothetical protein